MFHIDKIKSGNSIYFPNIEAKISFISSEFAALVLTHLCEANFSGPINAASPGPISLKEMIEIIEKKIGKKATFSTEPSEENHSPYGIPEDWYMNCDKLSSLGLTGESIQSWMPKLISQL